MYINNFSKAEVLADAVPYIQKYNGKIVVVKYGGNAMINDELKKSVMEDIVLLNLIGVKTVLVHGGGPSINEMLNKVGKESKFVNGLRYTDEETMDIVQMVLCGKVNKDLVGLIENKGGKALGLCGIDYTMIKAKQISEDLGLVGEVTKINPEPIFSLLEDGYIPVIASLGIDDEGNKYNINADTAASAIASSLKAENFLLLTDIKGLMRDKDDEDSLIPELYADQVEGLVEENVIQGGMIPKVDCCVQALENGVEKSVILDGRIKHSILVEILTNEGLGTLFKKRYL